MTPRTAKLLLTVSTAVAGALGDVTGQMALGQLVNVPRSVAFGLALGVLIRGIGAGLAYLVEQAAAAETPPAPPPTE